MPKMTDTHNDILKSVMGDEADDDRNNENLDLENLDDGSEVDNELNNDDQNDDQNDDDNGDGNNDATGDVEERQPKPKAKKAAPKRDDKDDQQADPNAKFDKFDPSNRLAEDKAGNLLDKNGRVIVRRGTERRLFEEARTRISKAESETRKMAINTRHLANEARKLYGKYKELEGQKNIFEQAGLSFDEQRQMLDIGIEFKKNPVDGIKKFLTMAHMSGIDISKLGVSGGLDTRFVAENLKEHITKQFEQQKTPDRVDPAAEAEEFLATTPAALEFAEEVGAENFGNWMDIAKKKFPDTPYKELFQAIQLNYYRSQKNSTQAKPDPKPQRDKTPPRPNGQSNRRPRQKISNGSETFDDIGRDVLNDLRSI